MPGDSPDLPLHSYQRSMPSAFTLLVGASALFIAGCSAYFSVQGLGLLFAGSAATVMIMAASLEAGKLVAASFLYRHWSNISRSLRFYLTLAVVVLIGITSMGNYGYLAKAYEHTNQQINLLEQQIQTVGREMEDTQQQIDASKSRLAGATDFKRKDVEALRQRIAQADQALAGSLSRLDDRRRSAKERRDGDLAMANKRLAEQADLLRKGLESGDVAVAALNERTAVLDRAVDAYTKEGGAGFFKGDSIKKGQDLRAEQEPQRQAINAEIAEHRRGQEQLRADHGKTASTLNGDIAAAQDQYKQELSRIDTEERSLRQARTAEVSAAEKELAVLASQDQGLLSEGSNQIESLYQRIRNGNEETRHLREQIAATDIGSYRFVARVFDAGADDVVKWLMLILVLVFDPLAVALTVGFNAALTRERGPRMARAAAPSPVSADCSPNAAPLVGRRRWATVAAGCAVLGIVAGGVFLATKLLGGKPSTSHAAVVPGDSFAVMTLRPQELRDSSAGQKLPDLLGAIAGQPIPVELADLLGGGIDPASDLYAFLKYPAGRAADAGDKPVMICGMVAHITDVAAAEASLSRFADSLAASLQGPSAAPAVTRSRSMVRFGRGRYLDPKGGFLTFGLTDREAILLLEIEGDPNRPTLENEIRLCLSADDGKGASGKADVKLPRHALAADGPLALWFDAGRCFAQMPKNSPAQSRYQKLQKHLGFDLLLTARPGGQGQINLVGQYNYAAERFRDQREPGALEILSKLGPAEQAGIAGRLMDRCATTLDFDSLTEHLKSVLSRQEAGAAQVVVEKSIGSTRSGRFVLTARYDGQAGPPLVAAVRSIVN
jgi:hypothetical protein